MLDGPPAIGKPTPAGRYSADHTLTPNLDVDRIRALIGGWRDDRLAALIGTRPHAVVVRTSAGRIDEAYREVLVRPG